MGAAGFQMFNFNLAPTDAIYRIMRDLAGPAALNRMSRVYAITPAYYLDHEDTFQYRKQVPATLERARPTNLTLIVGTDFGDQDVSEPDYCGLRLGLRGASAETALRLVVNAHALHEGPLGPRLVPITGKPPANPRAHPDPPTAYFQAPVEDLARLRAGENALSLTLAEGDPIVVSEVQLGVLYTRSYIDLLSQ
jgi:hypothetical protein